MATTEDIQKQIKQASQSLGHDGFIYLYFQEGRIKVVGDASISVLTPLLTNLLASKLGSVVK